MAQIYPVEARIWPVFYIGFLVILSDASIGDIFYLSAAGRPIIVLNTQKVAADLLDRRAGIYSDRPRNIVAAQILCGGLAMVFQNYGTLCVYLLLSWPFFFSF
jgi:hypothetical protein